MLNGVCDYAPICLVSSKAAQLQLKPVFCIRMGVNVFSIRKLLVMSAAHGILFLTVLNREISMAGVHTYGSQYCGGLPLET